MLTIENFVIDYFVFFLNIALYVNILIMINIFAIVFNNIHTGKTLRWLLQLRFQIEIKRKTRKRNVSKHQFFFLRMDGELDLQRQKMKVISIPLNQVRFPKFYQFFNQSLYTKLFIGNHPHLITSLLAHLCLVSNWTLNYKFCSKSIQGF